MRKWLTIFLTLMVIIGGFFNANADDMRNEQDSNHRPYTNQGQKKDKACSECRTKRQLKDSMTAEERNAECRERNERIRRERNERKYRARHWEKIHDEKRHLDRTMGRYDDLTLSAARPTYATGIARTYLFNPSVTFQDAQDAYDSSGANRDITILAFGEGDVLVKDFLLASKLVADGTVEEIDFGTAATADQDRYLKVLANKAIKFLGEDKKWTFNFDFSRYVWKKNLAVGVQVPIVYEKHRLRASIDFDQSSVTNNPLLDLTGMSPNSFMRRYGQDTGKFLQDALNAKGMSRLGGSSVGLGDVTVFSHATFDSKHFDSMLAGLKLVIPTAKKASNDKLWAPELGNGGFFDLGGFWSMVLSHRRYLNPHLFFEASGSLTSAHVKRRVPKKITANNNSGAAANFSTLVLNGKASDSIAFGDRLQLANGQSFTAFDTTRPGMADNVARFKLHKGPEVGLHVGNIFRECFARRAFLDVYYDVRFKFRDWTRGLSTDDWMPNVYTGNTHQIAHKAGFEYSYQCDFGTRLRGGLAYVFAGKSVPKTFEAAFTLYHSF